MIPSLVQMVSFPKYNVHYYSIHFSLLGIDDESDVDDESDIDDESNIDDESDVHDESDTDDESDGPPVSPGDAAGIAIALSLLVFLPVGILLGCCGMWCLLKGRSLKKGPPDDEGEVGAPYEVYNLFYH